MVNKWNKRIGKEQEKLTPGDLLSEKAWDSNLIKQTLILNTQKAVIQMKHLNHVCACADLCTLPVHSDTLLGRRNLHWTLTLPVNILIIKSQLLGTRCPLQTLFFNLVLLWTFQCWIIMDISTWRYLRSVI